MITIAVSIVILMLNSLGIIRTKAGSNELNPTQTEIGMGRVSIAMSPDKVGHS